ncbi:MAG: DMT family transporter [Bacteroidia bacterium]|nr:DMT family transporter [Bacteroidia bacterium]MCF8425576.1 DMT family transporter [Bacteroidia bacterium]
MLAFWFSLAVNLSYFLADVFIKLGSISQSAGQLIYKRSLLTVLFVSIWLLVSGDLLLFPNLSSILWLVFCSIQISLGLYFYIKALQHLHFVNVAVIGICGAFIHYLLGILIFNETSSPWFILAATLSIIGIVIQWKKTPNKKGLYEAIISAILWGFGYALLSIPLATTSAVWGTWILEVGTLLLSTFYLIINDPKFSMLKPKLLSLPIISIASFTILGSVLLNICYQKFSLNIMGYMQLAFFPFSLMAGFLIFKEKLNPWEWIGNILVMLGLIIYFITCT